MTSISQRLCALNDAFRAAGPAAGTWMLTSGVNGKGPVFAIKAVAQVQAYVAFSPDNDPHGEHDFGSFRLDGQKLFWKIDCYDPTLSYGSEDPADPLITRRVMTIMLASEY